LCTAGRPSRAAISILDGQIWNRLQTHEAISSYEGITQMQLEKIITLASRNVRLQFLAMERSLRATGCDLPLWVIPYDDARFDLPANAQWWENRVIIQWLRAAKTHPTMRKYQCLLEESYQFVDTDVCFLRNPAEVLASQTGFVTSCCHWHNPDHTFTDISKQTMLQRTTTWQKSVFNTGQFACDRRLFDLPMLIQLAGSKEYASTCIEFPYDEQPGLNLLIFASKVPVTNLTLPPLCMESTWAGDYVGEYRGYWEDHLRKPYLIHWAGGCLYLYDRPVNSIFYQFLTNQERSEWDEHANIRRRALRSKGRLLLSFLVSFLRKSRHAARLLIRNR
jgi:hypothetical protein